MKHELDPERLKQCKELLEDSMEIEYKDILAKVPCEYCKHEMVKMVHPTNKKLQAYECLKCKVFFWERDTEKKPTLWERIKGLWK